MATNNAHLRDEDEKEDDPLRGGGDISGKRACKGKMVNVNKDLLVVLGRDLMLKVLSYLDARSTAVCLLISRGWHAVASADRLWTSKCEELWHGKAHIPRMSRAQGLSKLTAYSLSIMDSKRTRITKDDLCDHAWEFHYTREVPEYWQNLDPFWTGTVPVMHRYFHPDGSQTADPGDKVWGGHESSYSIVTTLGGVEGKVMQHYVRINRWPEMSVHRKHDWSWGMSNIIFSYSSIPDALKEGGTGPIIEALKAIGVTEVVLAINYQPEVMLNFLKDFESKLGIKITCSQETEPLGTAGPLALARDKLVDGSGKPFFVLNSDVISDYPLKEMIEFHQRHGGEASIMVTKVDEPSKYGVVVMKESTGEVDKFVEKPKLFVGNKINAGIYLLNPSVLDRIELKPTSIEKEVFPKIASEKKLFAMVLPGFWMDIGQPRDYITGLRLYLDSLRKKSSSKLASGPHIVGNVIVDETAKIGEGCLIGPDVAIGPGCVVEAGVRLSRCTVMRGVRIKKHACVSSSIVGWHSTVGRWARIENMTILGEDVHVGDEVYSNGGVVLPHKEIKSSILKPEIVM
ncbi:hypothetical protein ACFE04_000407 [Oxalis oulophora]